jgi:class 3 adenylate cyclase/tetratricopeptide (TPR) repeat protein
MICSVCGSENPAGSKFCAECGNTLSVACPNCGASLRAGAKFCNECGTPVGAPSAGGVRPAGAQPARSLSSVGGPAGPTATSAKAATVAESERRLVSVLFADLVGFTALSEQRDPEDVRELLTRYFETCRQLISRYGGTVEKFIGDAVMAVWGTPIAREDDAELAVRAAIDLTAAVEQLGESVGAADLRARAGVLTGEAAVTIGADGQGMVAGDMVNTAARIQAAANPGTVLVGDSTRRASEAAVAYEDAGLHELKGKAEPVQLWRALRIVAFRGGRLKGEQLEAPFVGREREMRLLKELFHASADERRAQLVSVTGIAGIGKSRLAWEFRKYEDGLTQSVLYHRGRCLSYGEGVTYWALAEMVRMRARIVEGEDQDSARTKLQACLEEFIADASERRWIEPRLAHLIGLEERAGEDRQELFAAWRLFFERLSDQNPTILVFEDMHWADPSLLDFIEHLMEWSRDHALFVMTMARPEWMERRPNWGAGKRNFTSLYLEPLSPDAMRQLLDGLVPGLSEELRAKVLERSEGVPLYAVETVRMLLDRGLLVRDGATYRPVGQVEALEVPETLHALIAARLDGLTPGERHLVQDASVMGKTFTKRALAGVTGGLEDELDAILSALVRKEVLTIQADPRSPERGQYGFLQDLLKRVAYDTISKKDRKAKHLAAAAYLEASWGADEDEIVEIVAAHYLDAYRTAPEAADAGDIKVKAKEMLARAGEHAASLGASEEAQRYFEQAVELTEETIDRGLLLERAGRMAWAGGHAERAFDRYEEARALFESKGETHAAARVSARQAQVEFTEGRFEQAIDRMERAWTVLSTEEPDEDMAMLAAELGRVLYFQGEYDRSAERVEVALTMAETLWLPEVLSQALNTKGLLAAARGHLEEGLALVQHALEIALEQDLPTPASRAYNNVAYEMGMRDRFDEVLRYTQDGVELARRVGNRPMELNLLSSRIPPLMALGRWDEAVSIAEQVVQSQLGSSVGYNTPDLSKMPALYAARGQLDKAKELLVLIAAREGSEDVRQRMAVRIARAVILRGEGNVRGALAEAEQALADRSELDVREDQPKDALIEAVEDAIALGDLAKADTLLQVIRTRRRGQLAPSLRAQEARFRARIAAQRDDGPVVEQGFKEAAGMFRELSMPFWLAVTLLEHGEWLTAQGRPADGEPLLAEAAFIFERLGARPWIERASAVGSGTVAIAAT